MTCQVSKLSSNHSSLVTVGNYTTTVHSCWKKADTHQNHQLPPKGGNYSVCHSMIMPRTRPLSDENMPNNLLMYPLLLQTLIHQMFGWRPKEPMPWLYRHWEVFHPSYFTFCSPKIHDFLFLICNTTPDKIRRAIFVETPAYDFIDLSGRVEGRTNKVSIKYQRRFLASPEALQRVHTQQIHQWFKCRVLTRYCSRLAMHAAITFPSWGGGTYNGVNVSCSLLQPKQPTKGASQFCIHHCQ